jgi:hypothetical protein
VGEVARTLFPDPVLVTLTTFLDASKASAVEAVNADKVRLFANDAFCAVSSVSAVVPPLPVLFVFKTNVPVVSALCTSAIVVIVPDDMLLICYL